MYKRNSRSDITRVTSSTRRSDETVSVFAFIVRSIVRSRLWKYQQKPETFPRSIDFDRWNWNDSFDRLHTRPRILFPRFCPRFTYPYPQPAYDIILDTIPRIIILRITVQNVRERFDLPHQRLFNETLTTFSQLVRYNRRPRSQPSIVI